MWTWKTFCSDGCLIETAVTCTHLPPTSYMIRPSTLGPRLEVLRSLTSSRRSLRSRIQAVSFDMLLDLILDRSFFSQHRNVGKVAVMTAGSQ